MLAATAVVTMIAACGSDNGNGPAACEGASCDGGSAESSTKDGPGTDEGGPTDGGRDADADAPLSVCTGDGGDAGSLDTTFGDGGVVQLGPGQQAYSALYQPDGKLLVGGVDNSGFALVRLREDGSPDPAFGAGGRVNVALGDYGQYFTALAIQGDGNILAAGSPHIPGRPAGDKADFALVRLRGDGRLDSTFGDGGIVTTDLGATDTIYKIVVLSDGRILAAGSSGSALNPASADYALARYNTNGSLDGTFGANGTVTTDFHGTADYAGGVAILSGGKILVAGTSARDTGNSAFDVSLARYNSGGSLDTTFANGGVAIVNDGTGGSLSAGPMVLDSTNRMVLAGVKDYRFAVMRIKGDATLDATFGTGGVARIDLGGISNAVSVHLQPDGKVIAAGTNSPAPDPSQLLVARFNTNGSLDPTFGVSGTARLSFGSGTDMTGTASTLGGCGFAAVGILGYGCPGCQTAMLVGRIRE